MPESPDDPRLIKGDAEALAKAVVRRLKAVRLEKGISRYRVARRTGLHQRAVKFVEEEERIPSIDTLFRLILAVGEDASKLIREAEEEIEGRDRPG